MFRGLRLRLTLLYLLAALALIGLVGIGSYWLLDTYFQSTTDRALQHRMAQEFGRFGTVLPGALADAERDWLAHHPSSGRPPAAQPEAEDGEHEAERRPDDHTAEDVYDGELAAIFVLPLSKSGQVVALPAAATPPIVPDQQAAATALANGSDWRTTELENGTRVRLLTYRRDQGGDPAVIQVGRVLADQDRVLQRLVTGLLGLGGFSTMLLGAASWWLAGRALRPAQQAWTRQQSFVANASHELRTPLTLLRASAEVAQRGLPADDVDRRGLLEDVLRECDHMSRLVDDLLLLSRLDAGQLPMARTRIELPALLAEMRRQVGRVAAERGVDLIVGSAHGAAFGDPIRLRQVLLIVLDNALRHTTSGGTIHLDAHSHGRQAQIGVADTGCGIAPEHLPHLFERFYRVDSTRATEPNGSGLGLAIAKALVEAQHGQIVVTSQLERGTHVRILLPGAET